MELVNKDYAKVNKKDIFFLMEQCAKNGEYDKYISFNKIISAIYSYEKENDYYISDFYVGLDTFVFDEVNFKNLPIKRERLVNAYFYSCINNDDIDTDYLKYLLPKKEVLAYELGDLLDYVLDNSINISEFYDGEEQMVIYNYKDNCVEKGYIFSKTDKNVKTK